MGHSRESYPGGGGSRGGILPQGGWGIRRVSNPKNGGTTLGITIPRTPKPYWGVHSYGGWGHTGEFNPIAGGPHKKLQGGASLGSSVQRRSGPHWEVQSQGRRGYTRKVNPKGDWATLGSLVQEEWSLALESNSREGGATLGSGVRSQGWCCLTG